MGNSVHKKPVVLIYRIGQLGDTLIAMPAIKEIRFQYPNHSLVLLTDQHLGNGIYVSSWDILGPTGWFDNVIFYDPKLTGWRRLKMLGKLIREVQNLNVMHLFNLAPSRSKSASLRDKWFFHFVASPLSYYACPPYSPPNPVNGTLPSVNPEWRNLLNVNFNAYNAVTEHFTLPVPEQDRRIAHNLAQAEGVDFSSRLVAIGPGSKMSAKKWPETNFAELGTRLLNEFPDVHLIVFGGKEDATLGANLCTRWGVRSTNIAGKCSVYGSAALLERCAAYVGNDTGTMHLAAMVGVPCVGIFSARDYPGKWDPYGRQHIVLRHIVACEGCMLEVCPYNNECIKKITIDDAFKGAKEILKTSSIKAAPRS